MINPMIFTRTPTFGTAVLTSGSASPMHVNACKNTCAEHACMCGEASGAPCPHTLSRSRLAAS
jgi:hypothetical protein